MIHTFSRETSRKKTNVSEEKKSRKCMNVIPQEGKASPQETDLHA
jgi:hypothetical protein